MSSPERKDSAAGHLVRAGFSIVAAIMRAITSRSTLQIPTPLANAPVLPLTGIAGDGIDWQDCPEEGSVNSINSVLALPCWLHGQPTVLLTLSP